MNILQSLKAISLYPIPAVVIENYLDEVGLTSLEDITVTIRKSVEYRTVVANLYRWLALAPNVTEGDVNYTLTDAQRADLQSKADEITANIEAEDTTYFYGRGYMGEDL